ncbi:MAG: hypothetical protein K2V38_29545, partial [Gemmataceae bacterium]|nr:hypothetical protein [Gemmataceae bacterium]
KTAAEIDAVPAFYPPNAEFKEGVQPDQLNRLYAVETMPNNTNAVADHRLPLTQAEIGAFARALAAAVGVSVPQGGATLPQVAQDWAKAIADDLKARNGKSVVVAGDHQPDWVHAIAHAINAKLGSVGKTVRLIASPEATVADRTTDLKTLTEELKAGKVDVLLILGDMNPAHTAPTDYDFAGALKAFTQDKGKFGLHLGQRQDETAVLCEWHVNEAHYLETWGDVRAHDGTATLLQPLIAPLHHGRSAVELLAGLIQNPADRADPKDSDRRTPVPPSSRDPLDDVRDTWRAWHAQQKLTGPFETFWQESVRAGVVAGTASPEVKAAANFAALEKLAAPAAAGGEYELNFRACPSLYDGRFANNGWLQELPKPLTKISWDNAAFLSPKTAAKLGVETNFRYTGGEHGRAEVNVIEI